MFNNYIDILAYAGIEVKPVVIPRDLPVFYLDADDKEYDAIDLIMQVILYAIPDAEY